MPSSTSRPGPIAETASPSTRTAARLTRCTRARMRGSMRDWRPGRYYIELDMSTAGVSPRAGGERVLLVEDEESISEPFSRALVREGFAPRVAASLAEARTMLGELEPDIVLLDLMLPDGDGRE